MAFPVEENGYVKASGAPAHLVYLKRQSVLAVVESEMDRYSAPYNERARVWVQLVREELGRSNPHLEIITGSLSVPSWSSWPPECWPEANEEVPPASESETDLEA